MSIWKDWTCDSSGLFFFQCAGSDSCDSSRPFSSVPSGSIADSVSKWVCRHSLPPEKLKAFLRKSDGPDDETHKKMGEKAEKQQEDQEDAYGTAGQAT